jgi:hypothetical protein
MTAMYTAIIASTITVIVALGIVVAVVRAKHRK